MDSSGGAVDSSMDTTIARCRVCRLPLGKRPVIHSIGGAENRFCCLGCASTYYLIQLLTERGQPPGNAGKARN